MTNLALSSLPHTWLLDVDGTILKHNGHLTGGDELLPGVTEFWQKIPSTDVIILLSARTSAEMKTTLEFLRVNNLRFDHALFDLPKGERILINDSKPRGLQTALAVNLGRDEGLVAVSLTIVSSL